MILYTIYYPKQWFSIEVVAKAGIKNFSTSDANSCNENNDLVKPEIIKIEILLETEDEAIIKKLAHELNKQIPETEMDYKDKNRGIIVKSNVSVTKIKNAAKDFSENE